MITNFKTLKAQEVFNGVISATSKKLPLDLHPDIQCIFDCINAIRKLDTLQKISGRCLERLYGEFASFFGVRVTSKWCVIFKWEHGAASDVDVISYR